MTAITPEFTQAALRTLYRSEAAIAAIDDWYKAALRRLPFDHQCISVATRLGQTHIVQTGNLTGRPVILLHGLMNNALIWEPQLAALQDFCVYAVDIIGQPGRSYPYRPSLLTDDYAHWLIDVMDGLGLQQAALTGLSMGALLALRFAAYAPARVTRLALLSPAGLATLKVSMYQRIIAANMPWRDFYTSMRDLMTYIYMTPDVEINGDIAHIRHFLDLTARYQKPLLNPRAAFEGILTGLPIRAEMLQRCTMPALVMVGTDDVMFDAVRVVRNSAQHLPQFAGAHIMPDSGHAMIYQQSARVNAALVDFLHGQPN